MVNQPQAEDVAPAQQDEATEKLSRADRAARLLCGMPCLVAITFVMLAIFVSAIVVGVLTQTLANVNPVRLIVDTDAGTDDAMALLLLLAAEQKHPTNETEGAEGPKVVAITTLKGNTDEGNVYNNVHRVLRLANRTDIPVYRGASHSLVRTPPPSTYFGSDGLGDVPAGADEPPAPAAPHTHAALALIELANKHPGELTLLCLGPLTNLALAIRLDHNILTKLKHVFILGGAVDGRGNRSPGVEFNFYVDPEANHVVFAESNRTKDSVSLLPIEPIYGMDIKMEWRVNVLGSLTSPAIQFLNQAEHIDKEELNPGNTWDFADPIMAAVVLRSELSKRAESYKVIPVTEGVLRGAIAVDYFANAESDSPRVTILRDIDTETYKRFLLDYLA